MVMQSIALGAQAGNTISNIISSLRSSSSSSSAQAIKKQYEYNLKLQREAQNYNTYAYQNRYQWQREDLEKAGLNPLYTMTTPSSPTSTGAQVGMPDMVGEKNAKQQLALQGIQLAQSGSAIAADNKLKNQETQNKALEQNMIAWETINSKLSAMYRKKELDNYDKKLITELKKMEASAAESITASMKNNAEAGTAVKLSKKIAAETKGIEENNVKLKAIAKLYKENPGLAALLLGTQETGGGNITKMLGGILGLGAQKFGGNTRKVYGIKDWRNIGNYARENLRKRNIRMVK